MPTFPQHSSKIIFFGARKTVRADTLVTFHTKSECQSDIIANTSSQNEVLLSVEKALQS